MLNNFRRRAATLALVLAAAALAVAAYPDGSQTWRMYEDKTYGFSIKYPRQFVILPEKGSRADAPAGLLRRVRFQDREVASWQTAELEPPRFTVEVYRRDGAAPLDEWLKAAEWVAPTDTIEPFEVEGAREALRVRQMRQLAPNEFYYVATEKYVFRLTPLGEHGPEMLSTFRLKTGK